MPKLKKISKKSIIKKLQAQATELWKAYCHKRDGGVCQVRKYFPNIAINHSNQMQIDHCFSRTIKELFLDVANGTEICSTCNQAKGSGKISASKKDAITIAVHEIVKKREGEDTYQRLLEIASSLASFPDWRNISYLEMQIKILTESAIKKIDEVVALFPTFTEEWLEKILPKKKENLKDISNVNDCGKCTQTSRCQACYFWNDYNQAISDCKQALLSQGKEKG